MQKPMNVSTLQKGMECAETMVMTSHIDINETAQDAILSREIKSVKMKQSSLGECRKISAANRLEAVSFPWGCPEEVIAYTPGEQK